MKDFPSVTLIIPTKNRPERLSACLASLSGQDYPRGRWQVVVVNDGGADPSGALAGPAAAGLPLTLIQSPARGPSAARNRGAETSDAELLIFLDDDCRAEPVWIRELACGIEASPYHACLGRTLNLFPGRWPAEAFQYYMEFYRDYARLASGDLYLIMSNNAVYRRAAFTALGGFNESFPRPGAEDLELSHRMAARGFRQGYLPRAVLHHAHCATAAGYLRQQFQYGRGYARMASLLRQAGIPLQVGQRRRPQFHLALMRAMLVRSPGVREDLLIWGGILAHFAGARWERIRRPGAGSRPAGNPA
jgi:cellulose synthase/poly-beta-1,6-N-acetylglucosamine synthase-like glycosyltransferase